MKKSIFALCLICIQTQFIYSQKTNCINGAVFQINTSEPVGYAAISIKGKSIGTAANDLGNFSFYFSDSLKNDTLMISSLGFKTYQKPINQILNDSIKTFYLDSTNIPIQPLFVLSKGETAEQIVRKAIKKIKKNYPTKMYYMDAFYRELCMRDDRYARLIEAAVSIQDFGYDTDLNLAKIKINEIRKSDSYLEYDLRSKIYKKIFGETNLILNIYNSDYVRAIQNCSYTNFLCKDNINRHVFTLSGCNYIDKKLIYVISYRDTLWDSKITVRTGDIGGNIYIQADDYAIIKFEWGFYAVNNSNQGKEWYFKNKYFLSYNVTYRKYDGKYYPTFIQEIKPVSTAMKTNSSDTIQGKQYVLSTLMVNNILTRRRDFSRIKNAEKEILTKDIYEKKFPYHPDFWKSYNIVLLNPLIQSVNIDLQKNKSLEEQFKSNGE
ncbi:MAG: hypothetical protein HOO91_13815 [Bacteroidales bacterium]|nr:hypothetical protein [Bacteroidales bacterium]